MSVLLALLGMAHAGDVVATSRTAIALRHDLRGEPLAPVYELVRLHARGPVAVDAYAGLEAGGGLLGEPDPDVYTLAASGVGGPVRWSAGRQQQLAVSRLQTVDGASVFADVHPALTVGAWGGYARHQDLDDLLDGAWIGRAEVQARGGPVAAVVAAQGDADPGGAATIRPDALVRGTLGDGPRSSSATLRAVAALPPDADATLEWARLDVDASPIARLYASAHAERRTAAAPDTLLGLALLDTFAPDGRDEVGAGLRWVSASFGSVSGGYALSLHDELDEVQFGHLLDAALRTGRGSLPLTLAPAAQLRTGPGGWYGALHSAAVFELLDGTDLEARGGGVLYRKLREPLQWAATGGVGGTQELGDLASARALVEVISDELFAIDVRASVVFEVGTP